MYLLCIYKQGQYMRNTETDTKIAMPNLDTIRHFLQELEAAVQYLPVCRFIYKRCILFSVNSCNVNAKDEIYLC